MKRILALLLCGLGLAAFCAAQTTGAALFHQEGTASWYGPEFDGRPTASGEIFNSAQFTAAHPTLPFGTLLNITNLNNNKQITVRVNDRGPFVAARIIDVSKAAAEALDMLTTGTAPVSVVSAYPLADSAVPAAVTPSAAPRPEDAPFAAESAPRPENAPFAAAPAAPAAVIGPVTPATVSFAPAPAIGPVTPATVSSAPAVPAVQAPVPVALPPAELKPALPPAGTNKSYLIQIGSYKVARNAVETFERLKNAGLDPVYERSGEYYRVLIAGIRADDVQAIAAKLGGAGFREALIREER
jgi:rare lipoprotein A